MKELLNSNTPLLYKDPDYKKSIVNLDIETAPSLGAYYDPYADNNIVWTERYWIILCMGWKYPEESEVNFAAIWQMKGWKKVFCRCCRQIIPKRLYEAEEQLMYVLWPILDEAKLVVGQNSDEFDIKRLNAKFIRYGFDPPSPYKTIDTKKEHKRIAKTDTNKLDDIADFYELGRKLETKKDLQKKVLQNDPAAQDEMERYNKQDVLLDEKLYFKERGWRKGRPYLNTILGKITSCKNCGGEHFHKHGLDYDGLTIYQRYRCLGCGANLRGIPDRETKSGKAIERPIR